MIIKIKQHLIFSLFLTLFALNGCQKAKDFEFLDGRAASIGDFKGKWLIVNFWAEWCAPCIEEFPELNKLSAEHLDIEVIGVSFDKYSNTELQALVDKLQIGYPVIASEPMPYLPMARPQSLPANYIVTPQGEVLGPLLGAQSRESLLKVINKLKAR